jgi:hypothetical protein
MMQMTARAAADLAPAPPIAKAIPLMTLLPPNRVPGLSILLPGGCCIDAPGVEGVYVEGSNADKDRSGIIHTALSRRLQPEWPS